MSRLRQQIRDLQVFDKKKSKGGRKHVANSHELVENLAANLVEKPCLQPGLELARIMECGLKTVKFITQLRHATQGRTTQHKQSKADTYGRTLQVL